MVTVPSTSLFMKQSRNSIFPKWSIQELPEVEICQLIDYHKQVFIHFQVAIVFWDFRASGLDTARYYVAYHIMRSCYYTNSALNFYLYCLSGSRFRYSSSTPFIYLLLFFQNSPLHRFLQFFEFQWNFILFVEEIWEIYSCVKVTLVNRMLFLECLTVMVIFLK